MAVSVACAIQCYISDYPFLQEQFYKNTRPIFAENLRTNKEEWQLHE